MQQDSTQITQGLDATAPQEPITPWTLRGTRGELSRATAQAKPEVSGLGEAWDAFKSATETAVRFAGTGFDTQEYLKTEVLPLRDRISRAETSAVRAAELIAQGVNPQAISSVLMDKYGMETDGQFGQLVNEALEMQGYQGPRDFDRRFMSQGELIEEWAASLDPVEFDITDGKLWRSAVPVWGMVEDIRDMSEMVTLLNRVNDGEASDQDYMQLEKWLINEYRPRTKARQLQEGVMGTIGFALDIAVSGGTSALAKGAIKKVGKAVFKDSITKVLRRGTEKGLLAGLSAWSKGETLLARGANIVGAGAKGLATGAAGAAETLAVQQGLSMAVSGATEGRTTRGLAEKIELEDQLAEAVALGIDPATGDVTWSLENNPTLDEVSMDSQVKAFIELFSERLSVGIGAAKGAIKRGGLAAQTYAMRRALNPGLRKEDWLKQVQEAAKTQFGGTGNALTDLIAETAEEYAVRFMGATYGSLTGDPNDRQVNWDEVIPEAEAAAMELATVALGGGALKGGAKVKSYALTRPSERQAQERRKAILADIDTAMNSKNEAERKSAQARVDRAVRATRQATPEEIGSVLRREGASRVDPADFNEAETEVTDFFGQLGIEVVVTEGGNFDGGFNPASPSTIYLERRQVTPESLERVKAKLFSTSLHEVTHDAEEVVPQESFDQLTAILEDSGLMDSLLDQYQGRLEEDQALTPTEEAGEAAAQAVENNSAILHGILTDSKTRAAVQRALGSKSGGDLAPWERFMSGLLNLATRGRYRSAVAKGVGQIKVPETDVDPDQATIAGLSPAEFNTLQAVNQAAALIEEANQRRRIMRRHALAAVEAGVPVPEEEQLDVNEQEWDQWLAEATEGGAALAAEAPAEQPVEAAPQPVVEPVQERVEPAIEPQVAAEPAVTPGPAPAAGQQFAETTPSALEVEAPQGTRPVIGGRVRVRGRGNQGFTVDRFAGKRKGHAILSDGSRVPVADLIPVQSGMPINIGDTVRVRPYAPTSRGGRAAARGRTGRPVQVERLTGPIGKQRAKLSDGRSVPVESLRLVREGDPQTLTPEQRERAQRARQDALQQVTRFSPRDIEGMRDELEIELDDAAEEALLGPREMRRNMELLSQAEAQDLLDQETRRVADILEDDPRDPDKVNEAFGEARAVLDAYIDQVVPIRGMDGPVEGMSLDPQELYRIMKAVHGEAWSRHAASGPQSAQGTAEALIGIGASEWVATAVKQAYKDAGRDIDYYRRSRERTRLSPRTRGLRKGSGRERYNQGPRQEFVISSAPVRAEKPKIDSLETHLVVGMDGLPDFKKGHNGYNVYQKIVEEARRMLGAKAEGMTDAQAIAAAERYVVNNLLWLYDNYGEYRDRAKEWYNGANRIAKELASQHGIEDYQAAAALAALSPQKDWDMNVQLARYLAQAMKDAQGQSATPEMVEWMRSKDQSSYDEAVKNARKKNKGAKLEAKLAELAADLAKDQATTKQASGSYASASNSVKARAKFLRAFVETTYDKSYPLMSPEGETTDQLGMTDKGTPAKLTFGSYVEVANAVAALDGASIEQIDGMFNGHKVRSFYNNILYPDGNWGDVTIDTHAVAGAEMMPYGGTSEVVKRNFGSVGTSKVVGINGTYAFYATAFRRAAAKRGVLPREMQSITWEAARGLMLNKKTDANMAASQEIWDNWRDGKISQPEALRRINSLYGGIPAPRWARPAAGGAATARGQEDVAAERREPRRDRTRRSPQRGDGGAVAPEVSGAGLDVRGGAEAGAVAPAVVPTVSSKVREGNKRKFLRQSVIKDVVYHGTRAPEDFDEFSVTRDLGYHVGTQEQAHSGRFVGWPANDAWIGKTITSYEVDQEISKRARVYPVIVQLKNPLPMPDLGNWEPHQIIQALHDLAQNDSNTVNEIKRHNPALVKKWKGLSEDLAYDVQNTLEDEFELDYTDRFKRDDKRSANRRIMELLQDAGFDGVVYVNVAEGRDPAPSYILFDSRQIKSVYNQGTYDATNPSIRMAPRSGETVLDNFDLPAMTRGERFMANFLDRFTRVEQVEKWLETLGMPLHGDESPLSLMRRYPGRTQALREDLKRNYEEPIIKLMRDSGIEVGRVNWYLIARHTSEANRVLEDRGAGDSFLSNDEARVMLEEMRRSPDWETLEQIGELVDRMNDETRNRQLEGGLISRDEFDAWESMFRHYVPFRSNEDKPGLPSGMGATFSIPGAESKRRKGRRTKPQPLQFSFVQARASINRAEKNRVGQKFAEVMQNARLLAEPPQPIDPDAPREVVDESFVYRVNGQQMEARLRDPDLARAIKNLDVPQLNLFLRNAAKVTRWMARWRTSLNVVGFTVPNFVKDHIQAQLIAGELVDKGFEVDHAALTADAGRFLKVGRRMRTGGDVDPVYADLYQRYRDAGGLIGVSAEASFEAVERDIDAIINETDMQSKWRRLADAMESVGDVVEQANRLATFKAMVDAGATDAQAADAARDITVDFNRQGYWSSSWNSLYMFFNAGVQGNWRSIRALKSSPRVRRASAAMFMGGMLLDAINAAWSDEDEDGRLEWDNKSFWDKSFNLHLGPVRLPLPYFWNLPLALGQATSALMRGAMTPDQAVTQSMGMIADTFLPVAAPQYDMQGALLAMTPSAMRPFADLAVNKNFMGTPIYREPFGSTKMPDSVMNPEAVTAPLWKAVFEATGGDPAAAKQAPYTIDVNPRAFEYLAKELWGGLGAEVQRFTKTATRVLLDGEVDIDEVPLIRRFVGSPNPYGVTGNFYEAVDAIDTAVQTYNRQKKANDVEGGKRTMERHPVELREDVRKAATRTKKRLSELRQELREANTLAEEESIRKKMDQAAGSFVKRYDALQEKASKL